MSVAIDQLMSGRRWKQTSRSRFWNSARGLLSSEIANWPEAWRSPEPSTSWSRVLSGCFDRPKTRESGIRRTCVDKMLQRRGISDPYALER